MFVHKSHSKNELIKIIKCFNLKINNPFKFRKIELSALIVHCLNNLISIEPCEEFFICNLIDLKLYLNTHNPNKMLSVKEKKDIIQICKKIKNYCKKGIHFNNHYCDIEDVYKDANYIKHYGDIPSVRKCLRDLNHLHYKKELIEPMMSINMKKILIKREQAKELKNTSFGFKSGFYSISF